MAGRLKPVANDTAAKAARLEALRALEGAPLPLPTERRTEPATYTDAIPAEVIALGAEGLSEAQIAAHLAIDIETLRGWSDGRPELKAALSRARTAMRAWWEEKARRAIVTADNRFPAGAWSQVMRARFSEYDDKPTVSIDLGSLVVIQRAEPPGKRTDGEPSALIEHASVRLAGSQTARDERLAPMSAPSGDPGAALSSAGPATHETDQPAPSNHPRGA